MTDLLEATRKKYNAIASELKEFDCAIYETARELLDLTPLCKNHNPSITEKSFLIALGMTKLIELDKQGSASAKSIETIEAGSTNLEYRSGDEMLPLYENYFTLQYNIVCDRYMPSL